MWKRHKDIIYLIIVLLILIGCLFLGNRYNEYKAQVSEIETAIKEGNILQASAALKKISNIKSSYRSINDIVMLFEEWDQQFNEHKYGSRKENWLVEQQELEKELINLVTSAEKYYTILEKISIFEKTDNSNMWSECKSDLENNFVSILSDLKSYYNIDSYELNRLLALEQNKRLNEVKVKAVSLQKRNTIIVSSEILDQYGKVISEKNMMSLYTYTDESTYQNSFKDSEYISKLLNDKSINTIDILYQISNSETHKDNKDYYIVEHKRIYPKYSKILDFKIYIDKETREIFVTDKFMSVDQFAEYINNEDRNMISLTGSEAQTLLESKLYEIRNQGRVDQNTVALKNQSYELNGRYYYSFEVTLADAAGWLTMKNLKTYTFYVDRQTKEILATDKLMDMKKFDEYINNLEDEISNEEIRKKKEENKKNPYKISLGELNKSLGNYKDSYVKISGTIVYIKEEYGMGNCIINDINGNHVHISYHGSTTYQKGSYVTTNGLVIGETSSYTINGSSMKIPSVSSESIY
jgi:hypothetical protein